MEPTLHTKLVFFVTKLGNKGELLSWAYTHDNAWRNAKRSVEESKQ